MATSKSCFRTQPYRFLAPTTTATSPCPPHQNDTAVFELDESDIFNFSDHFIKPSPRPANPTRKPSARAAAPSASVYPASTSLPVNIPDWSKILKGEYRRRSDYGDDDNDNDDGGDDDDDDDDVDGDDRLKVPPHELLRTRVLSSSFSVREGRGRTLKGRDLSRVRNAIWEKIGFQD